MKMELREFHNGLRVLLNLDLRDLEAAGIVFDDDQHTPGHAARRTKAYERFVSDPFRWFVRADDETADKLWALLKTRGA